jgi:hypothetical protein
MKKTYLQIKPLALAIAALGAAFANPAAAFKFEMENGLTGSFDSTISAGMQMRMQGRDKSIISNDNGGNVPTESALGVKINGPGFGFTADPDFNYLNTDDGNLNYKKHDIVSAVVKGTHELFLTQKGNWSALARVTWSSDQKADDTRRTPLRHDAEDAVKQNVTLLDLWVAKEFSIGEQSAKLKLGNQVMNWGEDIFIIGGVNAVNAFDLRKIHIPGVQLKEVFIPAPMLSFTSGLGNGFSTEAYYQFKWNSFNFDPSGTYWSSADFIGKGGKRGAFIPTSLLVPNLLPPPGGDFNPKIPGRDLATLSAYPGIAPIKNTEPKDSGQYGINLRFKPADSDTEFAGYYIHYHDKIPFVGFKQNLTGSCLFGAAACTPGQNVVGYTAIVQYGEDKELFGLSMNTKLGDWAVGAELSYRPRDSVAIDPTVPSSAAFGANPIAKAKYNLLDLALASPTGEATVKGYTNEEKYQAHVTGFYLLPQSITSVFGAAEGSFLSEVAVTHYPGLDLSGGTPYLLNNYKLPDKTSWGYVLEVGLTYANIFQSGWTMSPLIDFYHDVHGTSPTALPFVEGRKALALNLNFDYHNEWKGNIGYSVFWGGGNMNMIRDRDVLSMSISRTF